MKHFRTIAYLRAATTEHDFEKARASIMSLAIERKLGEVEWVEEFASGLAPWQERRIAQILEELQSGDNLIIQDISRLSRSYDQCLEILSITAKKEISVYAVNQPQLSFNLITRR
ncbi:recombinase family protein [Candidatus Leptofilum sp.]|uniref:recombinase family protein n=1 Tax=Candidatus Leptofilum sp. TaxID=3241576 RepID=UPI003B5C6D7E